MKKKKNVNLDKTSGGSVGEFAEASYDLLKHAYKNGYMKKALYGLGTVAGMATVQTVGKAAEKAKNYLGMSKEEEEK